MGWLPDGEVRPTEREDAIARGQVEKLIAAGFPPIGDRTKDAMAGWLAAVLCGYRLELLTGYRMP